MRQVITLLLIILPLLVHSQATTLTVNVADCNGIENGSVSVYSGSLMIALRKGKWKYVEGNVADPNPVWLNGIRLEEANEILFDLDVDPGEQNKVLTQYPEIAQEMITLLSLVRTQGYSRD